MKKTIENGKVVFTFEPAMPGGIAPEAVVFDPQRAHTANRAYAELHGWAARIGDSAAIPRKQADGSVLNVTEAMRRAAVVEIVEHYYSGSERWELRDAGAKRAPAQNATIAAIAAKRGTTYAEAEAYVAAKLLAELMD